MVGNPPIVLLVSYVRTIHEGGVLSAIDRRVHTRIPYTLDQRPLLYKGRTQIVASLASKMKHLLAALK